MNGNIEIRSILSSLFFTRSVDTCRIFEITLVLRAQTQRIAVILPFQWENDLPLRISSTLLNSPGNSLSSFICFPVTG